MKAILLLEDGLYLEGKSFGANGETVGEVVFNTAMTGYQEILTDPSYKGQIVCMTYPLIGNYGVNASDVESKAVCAEGFIVKEKANLMSSWRAEKSLPHYLQENGVVAIEGVDTRAVAKRLREKGSMKGIISTADCDINRLMKKLKVVPSIVGQDYVSRVSCRQSYEWQDSLDERRDSLVEKRPFNVVVIDCGVKFSILRNLKSIFDRVIVVPAATPVKEILKIKPQGILFSNGPGDPGAVVYAIATAKELIAGLANKRVRLAVMGICLGHQILGLALGGEVKKLAFGHHGGNHPVKDLNSGKIDITAQNHNFIIPSESITDKDWIKTHINLYDQTPEGNEHKKLPIFSVQFHPEAGPGPFDALYIFDKFARMAEAIAV
ncbi:MAG: glutamine-hydrolyzing carbamoyl-phosphate synthase small subunit [Candidatus Omnitrophota bacterium]